MRLRAQRLHPAESGARASVTKILEDVCGVQAQEPSAADMAVWVRGHNLLARQVEDARVRERSTVRTWCMRGTLHLLAAEDLGWLLPLLGPVFVRKSRRRYAELGLTDDICAEAIRAIRDILGDEGPTTRAELARALAERGIPTEGQAAYHLLRRAGLEGLVCFGPDLGREPTYVLLEDWAQVGAAMAGEAASRAELARRYLAAFGPAGPEDVATWSGLSASQARAGLEMISGELLEVEIGPAQAWMLKSRAGWLEEEPGDDDAVVRLLPSFDPYLLGYRGRDLSVPERYAKRVHPGGGLLRPTLLVDGLAAGTWNLKRRRDGLLVNIQPFESLGLEVRGALEKQVQELGRFYEQDAVFQIDESV
jgi:hypothetical protein